MPLFEVRILSTMLFLLGFSSITFGEEKIFEANGKELLKQFFVTETQKITRDCLADVNTLADWKTKRSEHVLQLREMLGLSPWPERTDLRATVTGLTEREGVIAEKVHFQSVPGLYVTGTFFRPTQQTEPLPAILYVCGHGRVKEEGISYGNKATYQHHGSWFAKNGYVCLMIDTIQLGEIEGIHHGTYREEMWWWHNHGYTSAGVEAWNGIRAIDFLQSRPEVNGEKIGITGRSGGGAYSWWVAALDERIKVAVPVAGITSMHNHIVDGCIEGHCDCMYMVNTYAWDFPLLASLIAPRPLLISNTDKDRIFPLDGVVDVYSKTRRIYELHDAVDHIGLNIAEGPHKDTQELRVNAFHWMNRFLKSENPLIETTATKVFSPKELKVFEELPADERVTSIQESFIPLANGGLPSNQKEMERLKVETLKKLRKTAFRNTEANISPKPKRLGTWKAENGELTILSYRSDSVYELPLYVLKADPKSSLKETRVIVCNQEIWQQVQSDLGSGFPSCPALETDSKTTWQNTKTYNYLKQHSDNSIVFCTPRGVGATSWNANAKQELHIKRRMALLGHTVDSLRIHDVVQCLRALKELKTEKLHLESAGTAADWALMAAVQQPQISSMVLEDLSCDFREGPYLLQVSQYLTKPQALMLAVDHTKEFDLGCHTEEQRQCWQALEDQLKKLNYSDDRFQLFD